jgi:hypothetical protein
MGTVEVLGMPLLTSAVDQQIEETATMEKKLYFEGVLNDATWRSENSDCILSLRPTSTK